jgi:uncharacterized protein
MHFVSAALLVYVWTNRARQMEFLHEINHRPYPMSRAPYVMSQAWRNLLFAHWRIEPAVLQALLPKPLEIDIFDGSAWLGVVPFRMCDVRGRCLPIAFNFLELNVRTYVKYGERKGVFFFSLDADHHLSVWGARTFYGLPYFDASMQYGESNGLIHYASDRIVLNETAANFQAVYESVAPPRLAQDGSLEHFLTERYCLLTVNNGKVYRTDIHHAPWKLSPARALISVNSMADPLGIDLPTEPDSVLYSHDISMVAWMPTREILAR